MKTVPLVSADTGRNVLINMADDGKPMYRRINACVCMMVAKKESCEFTSSDIYVASHDLAHYLGEDQGPIYTAVCKHFGLEVDDG